eukprot:2440095-Prymnesium_polylepis.1
MWPSTNPNPNPNLAGCHLLQRRVLVRGPAGGGRSTRAARPARGCGRASAVCRVRGGAADADAAVRAGRRARRRGADVLSGVVLRMGLVSRTMSAIQWGGSGWRGRS